jgi:hypothetical protein
METAVGYDSQADILDAISDTAHSQVQAWIDLCYEFRTWERSEILIGNPSPEAMTRHKKALLQLIKQTRFLTMMASADPESFDRETFDNLGLLSDQLQHSWEMFYNRPSRETAAKMEGIIAEVFPE